MDNRECIIKRKKKLSGIKSQMKNMSSEAIKAAIIKKRECNDKAQKVVLTLIEREVTEEFLLKNLVHINKSHYEDVIEERAIAMLCGYPLCPVELKSVPSKKYHISTKMNKVFDITERKNYCSNTCFQAGSFLKDQLYTSPLWLRDQEDIIEFKLLTLASGSGWTGEEVFIYKRLEVGDHDKATATEEISNEEETSKNEPSINEDDTEFAVTGINSGKDPSQKLPTEEEAKNKNIPFGEIVEKVPHNNSLSDKPSKKMNIQDKKINRSEQNEKSLQNVMVKMENTIRTWFTFDTGLFILGEEKVKEKLLNLGIKYDGTPEKADPYFIDRYNELCRRVNLMELKDTYRSGKELPSKPAPTDFAKLKEEAKLLEIKVKSFYRGDTKVVFETPAIPDDVPLPVLPAIDHHSAHITRRNIVLQKLSRTLPEVQMALGISRFNFRDQVKEFVSTLNLTASNISLRPFEWNIAAIILIKLLSLKNSSLHGALELEEAKKYLQLIFKNYELDLGYLDRLVIWLLDFNHLIHSQDEIS